MKTVVITGSARGFGLALAKEFRKSDCNVVICDVNKKALGQASHELLEIKSHGKVFSYEVNVTNSTTISKMISNLKENVKKIDIWINNAGVNQPNVPIWELEEKDISTLIDIDLKGAILCSKLIMPVFIKQKCGQIYNVEGHGSNDACILGLSIYGTSKRAITYFTEALAHEVDEKKLNIQVGKITPGIMITNFIETALGDGSKIELDEETKKVYNILGDYPDVIASFMVTKILNNKRNHAKFTWLTNRKAAFRFMTSFLSKRDFFNINKM